MMHFAATPIFRNAPTSRTLAVLLLLGLSALIGGCGGSSRAISVITGGAAQLQSISVGPPGLSISTGLTQQYTATGIYSDGSKQNLTTMVTWKSGAVNVASINAQGLATAVSLGSTSIIASYGTVVGTTTLTVSGAALTAIEVTPATPSIAYGSQQQFTATGIYSDFTTRNLTASVTWNSSTTAVATISSGGLASGGGAGTTTITATLGSVFGSTTLTVRAATLVSIAVTPANSSIANGTTEALVATGTYSDNTVQVITSLVNWTSSNPGIATVSPGAGGTEVATGVSLGQVTVTATLNGISGSTSLTVTAATLVSIAVTPATPSIANGLTQQFVATGLYTDGSTQVLTLTAIWNSSAPTVATISNAATFEGLAQSLTPGTTTITATLGTVAGSTTLTVTPATLVSLAVTPATAVISLGGTQQYVATGTYTDGTTQDLTTAATWLSSVGTVATISSAAPTQGLASASLATTGTTYISAISGTVTSPAVPLIVAAAFCYSLDFDRNSGNGTGLIYQWAITATGSLVALTTPTATTGFTPFSLTVDSTRQFVYVANYNFGNAIGSSISQYTKAQDGSLTQILPDLATAAGPNGITAHPTQPFVYVASLDGDTLSQYTIGLNGILALGSTVTTGIDGPASIAINPAGSFLYVANFNGNDVSQFAVQANGSLLAIAPPVAAGGGANYAVVDPTGRYVYVTNQFDNDVWQYTIQPDGSLVAMMPNFVLTDAAPYSITIDAAGANAYVPTRNGNSVDHYAIGPTGGLTLQDTVTGLPGATALAIDPSGHYAYVTDRSTTTISEFTIGANGVLTPLGNPNTVQAGTEPTGVITSR